jgi:GrxC family glutaredoxin
MQQIIEFSTTNPVLVTIFLVLLTLFLRTFIVAAGAKSINNMEAVRLMNKEDALVLDVRTQEEFLQGHIPGATNIPLGLVDARISDIHERKSSPVIIVCQSGNRSMQAARSLKKHGFEDIYNMSGGMVSWQQANLPVISGNKSGNKDQGSSQKSAKKKQPNISSSKEAENTAAEENIELGVDSKEEKIIVYTSGYCPYTSKVKKLFDEKGVEFQQVNLSSDPDMRDLVAGKAGQKTFPQIFVGDQHVGNCDELYLLEKEGKLNSVLGLKPA